MWCAPPRGTFSLSNLSEYRTYLQPWGVQLLHEAIVDDNLHAAQTLLIVLSQVKLVLRKGLSLNSLRTVSCIL